MKYVQNALMIIARNGKLSLMSNNTLNLWYWNIFTFHECQYPITYLILYHYLY